MTREEILDNTAKEAGYVDAVDMICINGSIDPIYDAMSELAQQEVADALSTQSPKWVKASERRPGGNTKHICRDSDNPSIVKHLYWNEIPVYYEWLDESPSSTHPLQQKIDGLREALERVLDYEDKWSIHDIAKQALETYK